MMAEYRMRRYVPVLGSLDDAVSAIGDPPPRKVARIDLPYGSACFALARTFVTEWCERWYLPDKRADDALRVAMALVDNAVRHTNGAAGLRVELRRGMLTVAVYDCDPRPPRRIEPGLDPAGDAEHGLTMVEHLCRAWGNAPTYAGGEVVWAVL